LLKYRFVVGETLALWVRRYLFDALIVLGAAGGILEVALTHGEPDSVDGPLWLLIAMMLLMTLPLLARRRLPFGAPAAVLVTAGVISFFEGHAVPYSFVSFFAVLTSSFLLAFLNDRREAVLGLLILLSVGAVVTRNDPAGGVGDYVFTGLIFGASWLAGYALNRRLAQAAALEEAAREREEEARQTVEEERSRIARELHDVVAHSVSVMTVQAGAVRRLLKPEQVREREALTIVEETGRQALTEMRRLLGLMRTEGESAALAPQPGMKSLERLVENVREAGLPVELTVQGEPFELPPGIDLSAYRIVQEALTNALRHAGPARAWVAVRYGVDEVEVDVENDGRTNGDGDPAGLGLVGMRERVALCGGELEAGPRHGGGFRISARLPVKDGTA
jgi:signal transduction histidine kinase